MRKYALSTLFVDGRVQGVAALFALAWTVIVSSRYSWTVLKAIRNPYNPGADAMWMILWIGFTASLLGSLLVLREYRNAVIRFWSAGILGAVAVILVLSGAGLAALIGLWVCIAAVLIGERVLGWFGVSLADDMCGRLTIALTLGVAAIATMTLSIALLKVLTPTVAWALLVAITLLELRRARSLGREIKDRYARFAHSPVDLDHSVLPLLCGFLFTLYLTWTVAPEVQYDSLNYHLAVPRIYLEERGLIELPYFFHSYFAHLFDLFITFGMALHSEFVPKTANAIFGVVAALGVYSLGKTVFTPAVGLWAAAFFYAMPLTGWLSGTAYSDLAVALFVIALVIAFLRWNKTRDNGWIWVTGLLAGSAIAMKLNAAYAVIGLGLALLGLLLTSSDPNPKTIRVLAIFAVSAGLMALPWYGLIYLQTGNPIFPLMNGIFKSPKAALDNTLMNAATFGIGTTPGAFVRLPFMVTFNSSRFGDPMLRGGLGPLLLFFIPFGLAACWRNLAGRILAVTTVVYLILWAYTFQYGRYYFAIFPLIAVLGVAGAGFVSRSPLAERVNRTALAIMFVLQVAALPVQFWNIPERFPVRVALGLESRESFLNRALAGYAAAIHINKSIAPGERVLGINTENLRFYLKAPLETLSDSLVGSEVRRMSGMAPGTELARALSDSHFSHLLVGQDSVRNPDPAYPYMSPEFLKEFAVLEYSDKDTMVFKLKQ